jgi:hypothetical protein
MSIYFLGEFYPLQSISPDHAYLLGSESLPAHSNIDLKFYLLTRSDNRVLGSFNFIWPGWGSIGLWYYLSSNPHLTEEEILTGLNPGSLDCQSNALPMSYFPSPELQNLTHSDTSEAFLW